MIVIRAIDTNTGDRERRQTGGEARAAVRGPFAAAQTEPITPSTTGGRSRLLDQTL